MTAPMRFLLAPPSLRRRAACWWVLASAALALVLSPGLALGWGATGHRLIGRLAVEALPASLPAFVRSLAAVEAVGELAREPDRWKGGGRLHDTERDPAHFLDVGDDGLILGGPTLAALPPTREAFETALRTVGADSWKSGWLPYAIVDAWEQLVRDFAYWRADTAGAKHTPDRAHRAWLAADGARREALTLRDLGMLAHYVGDGSQPMHVSEHFNGWGDFPNPEGFTQGRIHASYEGAFVRRFIRPSAVRAEMSPFGDCRCPLIERTEAYLAATNAEVRPLYQLFKSVGYMTGDPRWRAFTARRLAAGASELRDEVDLAWQASADAQVGWPAVKVADIETGKVDPYDSLYGED